MAKPLKTFDLYAEFSCTGCGECCRQRWEIPVEREAMERAVELLEHGEHPGRITAAEAFRPVENPTENQWAMLQKRDDGSCVFLEADNACYWHRHFGFETKGWVCRSYPNTAVELPNATLINASFSCPPLVQNLVRRSEPMRLVEVSADGFQSALERPRWTVPPNATMPLGQGQRLETEALQPLLEALLEFPQITNIPLGARIMMGRLFLQHLIAQGAHGTVGPAQVQSALEMLEADATPLYVDAVDSITYTSEGLATSVRGFMARMARSGVPSNRAAWFQTMLEALRLNDAPDIRAAHLAALHRDHLCPTLDTVQELVAAYGAHRLATWQGMIYGGVLAAYTEVVMALVLVWALTLGIAYNRRTLVDDAIVAEAIVHVERIFFHTPNFPKFFAQESKLQTLFSTEWAGIALAPWMGEPGFTDALRTNADRTPVGHSTAPASTGTIG